MILNLRNNLQIQIFKNHLLNNLSIIHKNQFLNPAKLHIQIIFLRPWLILKLKIYCIHLLNNIIKDQIAQTIIIFDQNHLEK